MASPAQTTAANINVLVDRENELTQAGWDRTPRETHAFTHVTAEAKLWSEFATLYPQQAEEFMTTQKITRILSSNKDRT